MAGDLDVRACWSGGMATEVVARDHAIVADEPVEVPGGGDTGMMPTELFCAALASCFCLALVFAARRAGVKVSAVAVRVRARRAGAELRYESLAVEASGNVSEGSLEDLLPRARRLCWVSNTLAAGTEVTYGAVDGDLL